jgi:hypothetical protein
MHKRRRKKKIGQAGGLARMQQLRESGELSAFQSEAGKKGYRIAMEKHGKAKIVAKIADYRRSHPSQPEARLHILLRELGVVIHRAPYGSEGLICLDHDAYIEHMPFPDDNEHAYILDVAWPALKLYLEIDGPVHTIFDSPEKQVYNVTRDTALVDAGWQGYRICSEDLHTDYGASILAELVSEIQERANAQTHDVKWQYGFSHTYDGDDF